MSERLKLGLVSLWLFLSFPFNVAMLKHVIRVAFLLVVSLYAGLDRWLVTQYFLAMIFVLWVIVLLMWGTKLGHTLAVVLLVGSCCILVCWFLLDVASAIRGFPHGPRLLGWVIFGVFILLNAICLRVLIVGTKRISN